MPTSTLRYQLPKKSIKSDCPDCGPKHHRTLSRYVDLRTGEPLPEIYGKCDRAGNCCYHLSPYQKSPAGMSYADEVYERWKEENARATPRQRDHRCVNTQKGLKTRLSSSHEQPRGMSGRPSADIPVYSIPDELFERSVGHYDRNQFARLLGQHFGVGIATELLNRFQIGTSSHWPGACVFWYIDEYGRKRGGQIKLFGNDWHTVRYVDPKGKKFTKTSWVHSALIRRFQAEQTPLPDWLTAYEQHAERSPCLFGLPQLSTGPADKPVGIVEAPKTAILCTPYFEQFIWLAVGAKSYLTADRLAPLKNRDVVLFPDVNAYYDLTNRQGQTEKGWVSRANELRQQGYSVTVSDYLEQRATDEEKAKGLDLADYLLNQWKGYPPDWG